MGEYFFFIFFASCTSNRGEVSRIVKELQYLDIKEKLNRKWDGTKRSCLKSLQHCQLSGIMQIETTQRFQLCWQVFFQLYTNQSHLRGRNLNRGNASIWPACREDCGGIFLIIDRCNKPIMSLQVALWCIRNRAEQAVDREPGSSAPPRPLPQVLPPGSCLEFHPVFFQWWSLTWEL